MVAGDPEKRKHADRVVKGIPVIEAVHADFVAVSPDVENVVIGVD
jgi:hypothetical protein